MLSEDDLAFYEHLAPEARPAFLENIEGEQEEEQDTDSDGDDDDGEDGDG